MSSMTVMNKTRAITHVV